MVSKSIAVAGSSKSEVLFDLVVLLNFMIIRFKCNVHFIYVEGTRMIIQGTYELSRGDMYEVILKVKTMLSFLLLEKSALVRSHNLSKWIEGWASTLGREVELLDPDGWFKCGHNHDVGEMDVGVFWIPRLKAGTFFWISAHEVTRIVVE